MIDQLVCHGLRNIIILDNNSSTLTMRNLLDQMCSEFRVIRYRENYGPLHVFRRMEEFNILPDVFCLTDPDLLFNESLPEDFLLTLHRLTKELKVGKAGFALKISDHHLMKNEKLKYQNTEMGIQDIEQRFWAKPVGRLADGSRIFKADIDTTFALYNKSYFRHEDFYSAVRVAGSFEARHLPWYVDDGVPPAELAEYKATQRFSTIASSRLDLP